MVSLAGWRFLVFALIGAASIVLLASIGVPSGTREVFDRHTGQRTFLVRNVADAFFEARATGNAEKALAKARSRLTDFPENPVLERVIAILEAELGAPDLAPSHFHPDAATVAAEQARATRARAILGQRLREPMDKQALLALLDHLEADDAIAVATETFFAPLLHQLTGEVPNPQRPDEWAVRNRADLRAAATVEDAEKFLEIAQAFRAQGRMRARIRWLLRAYAALPVEHDLHAELAAAYLESGRLQEAFLVIGAALPHCRDDLALWRRRADLAGWLSLPQAEVEAHEVLLESSENLDRRRRLLTLYQSLGLSHRAVPHARTLARGSDDLVLLERPANLALQGGQVDLALEILEEQAERSDDPVYWREKIITYAWQDLRLDRVESELRILRDLQPEGDYEQRLETLLRQRDEQEKLLALLIERMNREPENRRIEQEVLQLHSGLGNREAALAILQKRVKSETDPRFLFKDLTTYHALGVKGLSEHAQTLARSPLLEAEGAEAAIDSLRPLINEPGYLDAALIVARRFPHEKASRTLLIEVADREPTDVARAAAAELLALEYPADAAYTKAWVDRSSWAGETESEVRAREAWLRFEAADLANRRALGDLYSALRRPGDAVPHWRYLSEREGLESESVLRLIDSLFASDQVEEAIVWLEKRASLPGTSVGDRLHVATQLFGRQQYDRALRFYLAVLDLEENNPESLLRIGQIRSWTNDPRGAIPFYERRLEHSDEQAAEVHFYLGESHWALRNEYEARRNHRLALESFQQLEAPTTTQEVMVAKMLSRFGRVEEARPIFERVLSIHPDHVDLILDYADSLVSVGDVRRARELVDSAKLLEPDNLRVMRLDGSVALLEDRYLEAATILGETLEQFGPDAGTESELGRARELHGDRALALAAYERSLTLQPDNRDVEQAVAHLADELAGIMSASLRGRFVEEDSVFDTAIAASTSLGSDRSRAGAMLGYSHFTGRSQAVDGGATDVTANVFPIGASIFHRYALQNSVGGGLLLYPGAPGDAPIGGWAGMTLRGSEPYRILGARLLGHVLLDYPAAAPGLGGRRSGALLFGQHDLGQRFWAAFQVGYDYLSVEVEGDTTANGQFDGLATLGWRIHKGSQRVAEPLLLDRGTLPGLIGPDLAGDPDKTIGPLVSVWTSFQMVRLLGDQELAQVLPIGTNFDFLSVSGRGDFHLARGWGAKVEATLGTEISDGNFFGQLEAGLTWRPSRQLEGTLTAGYGLDMQRSNRADVFRFGIGLRYRW